MRILLIAAVSVLFLYGCIGLPHDTVEGEIILPSPAAVSVSPISRPIPSPEPCDAFANSTLQRNACILNLSLSTGSPGLCFKISNLAARDNCYFMHAASVKSVSPCLSINSDELREYCRRDSSNSELPSDNCSIVPPTLRTECYFGLAVQLSNTYYCGRMPLEKDNLVCIEKVAQDTSDPHLCERLPADIQGRCIYGIANHTKNADYCGMLVGASKDDCYSHMAIYYHDREICGMVADQIRKEGCTYFFTPSYLLPDVCGTWKQNSTRDLCYSDFARINLTLSFCDNVTSENIEGKETCIRNVAVGLANSTLCFPLNDPSIRDSCFSAISIINRSSP
ncbi:MAG: hypothetical protein ABH863_03060 [Candidatus Micrarchaeota archaeon]